MGVTIVTGEPQCEQDLRREIMFAQRGSKFPIREIDGKCS